MRALARRIAETVGVADFIRSMRTRRAVAEAARFYRPFVPTGSLCFDIGANIGDRTDALRSLGARVVAVDAQPACADAIRRRFAGDDRVHVVQAAVGPAVGEATMQVRSDNPTSQLASLSADWVESVKSTKRFDESNWDQEIKVPVTTLDALIEQFGVPAYTKVDVEGFEREVLSGLSRPLPCVSLEFVVERQEKTQECVRLLEALGVRQFAVVVGGDWRSPDNWESGDAAMQKIRAIRDPLGWGDLYAKA